MNKYTYKIQPSKEIIFVGYAETLTECDKQYTEAGLGDPIKQPDVWCSIEHGMDNNANS